MHLISLITQGFIKAFFTTHFTSKSDLFPGETGYSAEKICLDFIHHDRVILVGRGWKVTGICVASEQSVFRVEAMRQGGVAEQYCGEKMKLSRLLFDCVWFTGLSLPSSWLFYNVVSLSLSPYLSFAFPFLSLFTLLSILKAGWFVYLLNFCQLRKSWCYADL